MSNTILDTRTLPLLLDVKKAADLMQVSEWHLRQLLRTGEVAGKKVGKGWRIPTSNVLEYLGIKTTIA